MAPNGPREGDAGKSNQHLPVGVGGWVGGGGVLTPQPSPSPELHTHTGDLERPD